MHSNMLRTTAALLSISMLAGLTGCGGGDGDADASMMPDDDAPMEMAELGEWNALPAGTLDIRDANSVLRAYYDAAGGHVMASAPTQPAGMGTATWNGQWSGKIEVSSNPAVAAGLSLVNLTPADLAALSGGARIAARFDDRDVEATLTYMDTGLDSVGLAQITSDRVSVSGGRFRPTAAETFEVQSTVGPITFSGVFAGEGAFGGTDAKGVAGYVGGDIASSSSLGQVDIGTFQSVFYGTRGGG